MYLSGGWVGESRTSGLLAQRSRRVWDGPEQFLVLFIDVTFRVAMSRDSSAAIGGIAAAKTSSPP